VDEICSGLTEMERVVFHPEYTYSDFVGQIMPAIADDGKSIEYKFVEGPFTRILMKANKPENENRMHYLVIEEINRGNAPAIFGDIFQLLDRKSNGESKYGIKNVDIAEKVFGTANKLNDVKILSNVTILATMNTSDQNVFTLDTAFQRRWEMVQIPNSLGTTIYLHSKLYQILL
jgi:5-methylcytosine-specific restriction endonuclease McrBC GTP-binding regulatory subunit McrB